MFQSRRTVPTRPCLMSASLLMMVLAAPASGVEDSWPDAPRAGKPATGTATQGSTGRPPAAAPANAPANSAAGHPESAPKGEPTARQADPDETPTDERSEDSSPAADAPPAPPRNPPLRMETRRNRDLARELERQGGRRGQALWVGEGQEPFLAVLTPQEGLKVKGGLILLHDQAQHPDWPGILHALRTRLPAGGWMTLSVAVPDFIPPPDRANEQDATPDATEKEAKPSEPDGNAEGDTAGNDAMDSGPSGKRIVVPAGENGEFLQRQAEFPPDEYQQEVRSRIGKAIERLASEQDMPIALAALGQTAGLVSGLLAMAPDDRLDALVLVEPESFPQEGFNLVEDVGQLDIPVLDIVNDELDDGGAALRKQEAGRNANSRYEQRRIMSANRDFKGFETSVAKSVGGWMGRRMVKAPASVAADKTTGAPSGSPLQAGQPANAAATVVAPVVTASPLPPPPVPGNPRLVVPNLQEPVPVPPPVPAPTP